MLMAALLTFGNPISLHAPNLSTRRPAGQRTAKRKQPIAAALPPVVAIVSPQTGSSFSAGRVKVMTKRGAQGIAESERALA